MPVLLYDKRTEKCHPELVSGSKKVDAEINSA